MKQYIKNGRYFTNSIIVDGMLIINPTHDQLLLAGYTLVEHPLNFDEYNPSPSQPPTNELLRQEREKQYKLRSDSYFIAYLKYLTLGDVEKAEQAKKSWLEEIQKINNEYPYGEY